MRAGTPGRGASANRSSIPRSLSEMSCKAAQRSRQSRAVSAVTDRCRAISALPCPSFAANTIRARKTSCCALPWRFVSRTNAVCSSSHNVIWVARFGIGFPLLFPFILSHGYLCPRVLGFMKLISLGFGTFFVTYRNISNNCPLVLWWGDPSYPSTHPLGKWYPLFPRRTNISRAIITEEQIFNELPLRGEER